MITKTKVSLVLLKKTKAKEKITTFFLCFGLTLTLFSNVKNLLSLTTIAHSSRPATKKQDSLCVCEFEKEQKRSCRPGNGHLKRKRILLVFFVLFVFVIVFCLFFGILKRVLRENREYWCKLCLYVCLCVRVKSFNYDVEKTCF